MHRDRFIATAQLGITLASLGLGMYGELALAGWLEPRLALSPTERLITAHTLASVMAIGALTYLHIFLGEMVPKAVALAHAERAVVAVHWPMQACLALLYPFVVTLNGLGNLILRTVGLHRAQSDGEGYTPEELRIIVEESARSGVMPAESGSILRELLEFSDLTAAEAMVPRVRVVGIPVGVQPSGLRALILAHGHTRYPIYDGDLDHIAGMLHVKDLLRLILAGQAVTADVRPLPVVPETATLDTVLRTMQRAQAHMALVIDEHGGTAGVVSLEDLFEEVVGELDEGQPARPPLQPQADGSVLVAGTVRLDELGQHFDMDLSHKDVDSVSGVVLTLLGRPPALGDVVVHGRVRLEVTAVTGRGVKQARAVQLPDRGDHA
jgi:CBS domain containing-hemolysin-like protein